MTGTVAADNEKWAERDVSLVGTFCNQNHIHLHPCLVMVQSELIAFLGREQICEDAGPGAGNIDGSAVVVNEIRLFAYCLNMVELG